MIAIKQVYHNKRIQLDGSNFSECVFENCHLHFAGVLGMEMHECRYNNCTWHLDGAAAAAVKFMASVYRIGGAALIENTFDQIRGITNSGGPTFQ